MTSLDCGIKTPGSWNQIPVLNLESQMKTFDVSWNNRTSKKECLHTSLFQLQAVSCKSMQGTVTRKNTCFLHIPLHLCLQVNEKWQLRGKKYRQTAVWSLISFQRSLQNMRMTPDLWNWMKLSDVFISLLFIPDGSGFILQQRPLWPPPPVPPQPPWPLLSLLPCQPPSQLPFQ